MGYSKVFDIMAYDKHTLVSITDDKPVKELETQKDGRD